MYTNYMRLHIEIILIFALQFTFLLKQMAREVRV